jgi:hypothetical protein
MGQPSTVGQEAILQIFLVIGFDQKCFKIPVTGYFQGPLVVGWVLSRSGKGLERLPLTLLSGLPAFFLGPDCQLSWGGIFSPALVL